MASLIPMILLDGTKGCERLRAGSLTTLNTWLFATTTESSLSVFLSRLMRRETRRDLRSAPGSRLWHQVVMMTTTTMTMTWEQTLAPSKMVVDSVSLNSWLHMWARMCQGAAGIDDFPIWVQLIP